MAPLLTFLLGFLMLVAGVAGNCIITEFFENPLNETDESYVANVWCQYGKDNKMKCSKLYMDKCVSNFNGELRKRQASDETNKDMQDLNRSCDCYIKAFQWELTCNCAVGGGMNHQLRRHTTIRLDSMGADSVVNGDGIPLRRGYTPCMGEEIENSICENGPLIWRIVGHSPRYN